MLKYARTLQGAKAMQNIISKIIAFSKQLVTDTKERANTNRRFRGYKTRDKGRL